MANDQEWTYLAPGTKKNFPTSFDTHRLPVNILDAEATHVEKKKKEKKGSNKISTWEDGPVPVLYHMGGTVIDLCPGSGQPALRGLGGPIPFMGKTPSHWPHSKIGPRTPPGTPPADKPFFINGDLKTQLSLMSEG